MYRTLLFFICLISLNIAFAGSSKINNEAKPEVTPKVTDNKKESIKKAISHIPTQKIMFNVMPATKAARQWLKILDSKKYDEAWEKASPMVQKAITKEAFINQARRSREPLGQLVNRDILMAQPHTQLPGSPEGKYVLITFKCQFHNKAKVTESVMVQEEPDTTWKVAGYFIL